jgi:hypothetical protein
MSITRCFHAVGTGDLRVGPDDVVLVDEAGMVGTRTLNRLAAVTEAAGAKLVLVGDPYQLPELTAGGLYRHLTTAPDAVTLTENRRQQQPWEQAALAELRTGDPAAALDAYRTHGRIHEGDTIDDARRTLVDAWHTSRSVGEDAVMIAVTNRDVEALNQLARTRLQTEGRVGRDVIEAGGRCFAVGDQVMTLRNDPRLDVFNGVIGTITTIDTTHQRVTIRTDTPAERTVPFAYIAEGGLTHAYALTLHKAQGVTVDRAFILARDGLPREHAYTALSRGRLSNDLYVADPDRRADIAHTVEINDRLEQRVEHAIGRTVAHQPALAGLSGDRLAALRHEEAEIRRSIGHGPPDRSRELADEQARLRQAHESLDNARWREQRARDDLDRLGPIGRRLHPATTREATLRLDNARSDINRHAHTIDELETRVDQLETAVQLRDTWQTDHAPDLERLAALRSDQTRHQLQLDHVLHPKPLTLAQGIDHGIDLGL